VTLSDIARVLRHAKVPRSKTIEHNYPQVIIVHVPATHLPVVQEVFKQLQTFGTHVQVTMLDGAHSLDVGPSQHVYYKVKSAPHRAAWNREDETRRQWQERVKRSNRETVIEYAAVPA
jgi:hypothetical protein